MRFAYAYPSFELCGGPEWIIVSSIGYVVLSGKMHVDKQDTSLTTPNSRHASKILSFISVLCLQGCALA